MLDHFSRKIEPLLTPSAYRRAACTMLSSTLRRLTTQVPYPPEAHYGVDASLCISCKTSCRHPFTEHSLHFLCGGTQSSLLFGSLSSTIHAYDLTENRFKITLKLKLTKRSAMFTRDVFLESFKAFSGQIL